MQNGIMSTWVYHFTYLSKKAQLRVPQLLQLSLEKTYDHAA